METIGSGRVGLEAVKYLIRHLVLLPRSPQSDDTNPDHERVLLETTIEALNGFQQYISDADESIQIQSLIHTVTNLLNTRGIDGSANEPQLASLFTGLASGTVEVNIPVEVKSQNAGLIVSRKEEFVIFQSFELSPLNADAMVANGRLVRSFPGAAARLKAALFEEEDLRMTLSKTIAKLASQPAPGFQPKIRKAQQKHDEMRDTPHSGMVTTFFMNVIAALGEPINSPTITKNTREEVYWSDSLQPWRRSPLWLLLRVSMHFQCSRASTGNNMQETLYKSFMVFLLSRVLRTACEHSDLDAEFIHATSAKLSRRIKKLELSLKHVSNSSPWMDEVCKALFSAHDLIERRWHSILDDQRLCFDADAVEQLSPQDDLDLEFSEMDEYIHNLSSRSEKKVTDTMRTPKLSNQYRVLSAYQFPSSLAQLGKDMFFQLITVESWVEGHLQQWLDMNIGRPDCTQKIRHLVQEYHHKATSTYKGMPLSLSIMHLTIMELWVACDKSACHIHPLLSGYDVEIPIESLHTLLLPLAGQMKRLHAVESYWNARRKQTNKDYPSVFRDFGHPQSFAVNFFDQSPAHQRLLSRIEKEARAKQSQKCQDLENKKAEYKRCMDSSNELSACEFLQAPAYTPSGHEKYTHDPQCSKCRWKQKAEGLEIQVYEWPLSTDRAVAKCTVFELQVPHAFSNWRDTTAFVLTTVLGSYYDRIKQPKARYPLCSDPGLKSLFTGNSRDEPQISVLSEVKPTTKTHRRNRGKGAIVNLTEFDVCVANGLKYAYFDDSRDIFTYALRGSNLVSEQCTVQLPAHSSKLQEFLKRPPALPDGIPPNAVIARQSDCPPHMSIHEFKAFCALPLGHRTVYMNILLRLAAPNLDFSKEDTELLIIQTIYQAGPPSSDDSATRDTHWILAEDRFGNAIIDQLDVALQRNIGSWEAWRAVATLVRLSARLLSLSSSLEVQEKCLLHIKKARTACFNWIIKIGERASACKILSQKSELQSRGVQIALLCISTFDLDPDNLETVLRDTSAASKFLHCLIVVRENTGTAFAYDDWLHRAMLQSSRRLAYKALPILRRDIVERGGDSLDKAIAYSWPSFPSGGPWRANVAPHDDWVVLRPKLTEAAHHSIYSV
jgi:hypothetical protein